MRQAETEPFAPALEIEAQGAEATARAQVPDLATDPDGDVQRAIAELGADPVRNVGARRFTFAPCTPSRATPLLERELLLKLFHSLIVPRGSNMRTRRGALGSFIGPDRRPYQS